MLPVALCIADSAIASEDTEMCRCLLHSGTLPPGPWQQWSDQPNVQLWPCWPRSVCAQSCSVQDFPGGSDDKSICLEWGRPRFDPWVGKIPWRRKQQTTPVLLPGKSHGRRSLVAYSPWGCKESAMTERIHFHFQSCPTP